MDWELGLDKYFDWYQLPESRRIQFAQMKLTGQARIYWRNLQATTERRHDSMITSWGKWRVDYGKNSSLLATDLW